MRGGWLVRLPTWLGDTVMAVATVRAMDRAYPGELTLWGQRDLAELLPEVGLKTPYIPYRRRPGLAGLWDAASVLGRLRRRRPGAALLLPNAFEPALLSALAGVPRRVGYDTDGRGWLLTDAVARPPEHRTLHEADRYAGLLSHLEAEAPQPGDGLLKPSPELQERATGLLSDDADYLGLAPGSANDPAKQWPDSYYAALASAAAERLLARPVLLGSEGDLSTTAAVSAACETPCIDLAGTGLVNLAAALLCCRAVISNDNGAAHLSAALGRPTVALFGPTDPQRTRPLGPRVRVVRADVFCQPCRARQCPLDHRCMTQLDPELVLGHLEPLWREAGNPTGS